MKKNNLFVLGVLLMALALPVQVQAKEPTLIHVDANSEIELQPDVAEFNISVTTKDKGSLEHASILNKEISVRVYHDLGNMINKANGDFIKTIDYSASPVYVYNNGKRIFTHFEVTNTIAVHTKKVSEIGLFIDKALELGATNVNNINFKLEDYNAYCNDLLSIATKKAIAKADAVAGATGQKVSGVKEIRTSCRTNNIGAVNRFMSAKMSIAGATEADANSTQVQGGAIKLYAVVDADFYAK